VFFMEKMNSRESESLLATDEILTNTRNLLATIDKEIEGIELDSNDRNVLSGSLFDVALDHSKAIVLLLENSIYASAYALARPIFESFVRAAWIQHCASDSEITLIIERDEFKLSFGKMLDAVENEREWPKTLTELKRSVWNSMHSYTHGGLQLISRRLKNGFIEHDADEQEVAGLLQIVALISFLSFNEAVGMSKGAEKYKVLNDLYQDLSSWCFTLQPNRAK
jgi:hypothetical protein